MRNRHARRHRRHGLQLESLERRACPAAISIGDVSLAEGTNASPIARLTVRLSERASSAVAVNWATADGTALAGNDYRTASGTLVFAPGQTSKTIGVSVYADAVIEPDETFSVVLSSPIGATLANDTATVTIRNDEISQDAVPSISVSDTQLPERNVGRSDAVFTVSLSAPTNVPVTVDYATADGSAAATDGDYAKTSSKLTFAPGETSKTVTVGVLGDSKVEQDESFSLVLSNAAGVTLMKPTGVATIVNDDFRPLAPVVILVKGDTVTEGDGTPDNAAYATFAVTLSRVTDSLVTVRYKTADITARAGDKDYVPTAGTLTFAPGETSKTVQVGIVGDTKRESDESFQLVLFSPAGATVSRDVGIAVIADDDTPPSISVSDLSVMEGNAGTTEATFVITLSKPWKVPVTVTYATRDGTATTADSDYIPVSGSVTIAAGETQETVPASVVGDTKAEIDETFSFVLLSADNATLSKATSTATIQNDDDGDVPGFQITIDYIGDVRQSIQDACSWAARRWEQVIVGDLPSVSDPSFGFTDDFRIGVREGLLGGETTDGQGGALANATALYYRPDATGLPWAGIAGIDQADAGNAQLRNIVLHEFGHALGFGGMWLEKGLSLNASSNNTNPEYRGPNAVREYNQVFGKTGTTMPIENMRGTATGPAPGSAGDGTYGVHWRESIMFTEVMTGFAERSGVTMPLSRITVGAMEDLGYTVNYSAADAYTAPRGSSAATQRAAASAGSASPQSRYVPPRGFAWSTAGVSQSVSAALAFGSLAIPAPVTQAANVRTTRTVTASLAAARAPVTATESAGPTARLSPAAWSAFG